MSTISDPKLKDKIEELVKKVPPPPEYLNRLITMLKSDTASVSEISKELAKDPVLAADTLRMVNSAYYGFSQEIKSLEQAIVVLGTKALLRLVIAAWAKKLSDVELKNFKIRKGELALFSLVGAISAVRVADIAGLKFMQDVIFTGSALRTIGRVAMDMLGPNVINQILKEVFEKKVSFYTASKNILGFTHNELGAYIISKWNIPQELVDMVKYYPKPSEYTGDNKTLAKMISCVHFGDLVAMQIGEGAPIDSMLYSVDGRAYEVLEINHSRDIVSEVYEMVISEIDKIKSSFHLHTEI